MYIRDVSLFCDISKVLSKNVLNSRW